MKTKPKPTLLSSGQIKSALTKLDRRVFDRLKKARAKAGSTKTNFGIYADETCTKFSPEFQAQLDANLERFLKDVAAMTQRIFSPEAIAAERARIAAEKAAALKEPLTEIAATAYRAMRKGKPPADAQG